MFGLDQKQIALSLSVELPRLHESQLRLLQSHDWPGNVRELQNAAERALISAQNGAKRSSAHAVLTEKEMKSFEKQNLVAALETAGWKVHGAGGAAELLCVRPTTLISRMKKLGIRRAYR